MFDLIKFYYIYFKRYLWGILSNKLVAAHVKYTPAKATEDTFREMLLEQIRYRQRLIEQKRWNLWLKLEEIAKRRNIQLEVAPFSEPIGSNENEFEDDVMK
jgi:hypothetical protein